ncbi:MAG: Gfo/Idh/MocA family oxidoreductase [Ruminococcaceae bacterium]|nr:Gfo/Idh/MocA family oxidoreductase [Oscillospiraceae bacterium]
MNLVFVGFKHRHTGEIYHEAMANPDINVLGAWEDTEDGKKLADGLGIEFNYETLEDVLNDERVDAICLGGCYGERGQEAIAALKAGKHVYGDKPICTSLEELYEIEKLSKEKGLKVGCYFTMRFSKGMKTIRELIKDGKLGEIGAVNMTAQHPLQYGVRPMWYFEEGKHGGTINDIAIHGVDLIRFLTGYGLKNVTCARTWNHFSKEVKSFKDCGQFMIELDNGAGFIGDVSYAAPASCGFNLETYWRITIWGTKGVVEYKLKGGKKEVGIDSSDGSLLQVALDGGNGFEVYDGEGYNTTGLEEFLKDIKGEESLNSTESVLKTSKDILTVQAYADKF